MPKAITNTSPLLYLYRIEAINWLAKLLDEVWTPDVVKDELLAGRNKMFLIPPIIPGSGLSTPSLCLPNGLL
jgi:hypothetical protein